MRTPAVATMVLVLLVLALLPSAAAQAAVEPDTAPAEAAAGDVQAQGDAYAAGTQGRGATVQAAWESYVAALSAGPQDAGVPFPIGALDVLLAALKAQEESTFAFGAASSNRMAEGGSSSAAHTLDSVEAAPEIPVPEDDGDGDDGDDGSGDGSDNGSDDGGESESGGSTTESTGSGDADGSARVGAQDATPTEAKPPAAEGTAIDVAPDVRVPRPGGDGAIDHGDDGDPDATVPPTVPDATGSDATDEAGARQPSASLAASAGEAGLPPAALATGTALGFLLAALGAVGLAGRRPA